MLYPDFSDLLSYKRKKFGKVQQARRKVVGAVAGNHASPFRGQGLDFDAVREYVPGDDIRNIDWRVTARTGSPHLKLFKEEKTRHTILCVDMNASMRFGTRNTFKSIQAARIASLLGWRALSHQDRVSACFFGDVPGSLRYFGSKSTSLSLSMVLKTLTEPPILQTPVSLETPLKHLCKTAQSGSLIYVISDFSDLPSDFLKNSSLTLLHKRCDIVFISINDPADRSLAAAGVIGFCGKDGEKLYADTDSVSGRKAYAEQWQSNRSLLNAIAKRFKIPTIALSTESDIQRDLLFSLKNLRHGEKCHL